MGLQRAGHPRRVVGEDVDQPEVAEGRHPRGDLRPAREDDAHAQTAGDESERVLVGAQPGDAVDVDRHGRTVAGDAMNERVEIRVADEDARVDAVRRADRVVAVARDQDGREASRSPRHPAHAVPHSWPELVVTPSAPAERTASTSLDVRMKPPASTGTPNSGSRAATDGRITPGRTSTMLGFDRAIAPTAVSSRLWRVSSSPQNS